MRKAQTALPALVKTRGGWGRRPHFTRDCARAGSAATSEAKIGAKGGKGGCGASVVLSIEPFYRLGYERQVGFSVAIG
jgi:hypothetical protein